jgi:hypothetical protein
MIVGISSRDGKPFLSAVSCIAFSQRHHTGDGGREEKKGKITMTKYIRGSPLMKNKMTCNCHFVERNNALGSAHENEDHRKETSTKHPTRRTWTYNKQKGNMDILKI